MSSPEKAEKALCRYADLIRAFEPSVSKRYVSYARALKMDPPVSAKKKLLGGLTGVPTMKAFLLAEPYMDLDGDIGVAAAAAEAARQIASKTKEEIDYAAYVRILEKARTVFWDRPGRRKGWPGWGSTRCSG